MFWTIAAAVLFAAALITLSPLLRTRSLWKPLALAMVFLVPAATLWMYQQFGTPEALDLTPRPARQVAANEGHSPDSAEMDGMIAGLKARLEQDPDSLDGWMLLARTYKATQQFPEALEALQNASRIAPENPAVKVELVETQIFMTADGRITPEMTAQLEQALSAQPDLQKALWLLGIAAAQDGSNDQAIRYWETLLEQIEPDSSVAATVQSQIDAIRSGEGIAAESTVAEDTPPADDGGWQGITLVVGADETSGAMIPSGGVLYIMVRSPGPAMGPPIGVRRIVDPILPLELTLSDQDSMMQERLISAETEVQVQARISLTGSPAAKPGDWQSLPQVVALDSSETVELVINQKVE